MKLFNRRSLKSTGRVFKNRFVTKSGKVIKLNRTISDRIKGTSAGFARLKADRLAVMPKNKLKRIVYRMHPKRLYHYWFSKEGGIMALKIAGIGSIACFLLLVGLFAYFRKDLLDLRNDLYGRNTGGSIRYYDRTGQTLLWEDYDAVKRIPVKDAEIAQSMKDATIATEDKDFFKHGGFDVRGIMRAGWNNAFGSGGTQGGSTITQQLVKLSQNWSKERTVTRKIKELILSIELERTYSKQEILTGYLNTAPYGGIEYGVEAAARDYFDKSAKDLTIDESAMLAAIPKSPRFYSAYSADFDGAGFLRRQEHILNSMRSEGMITDEQLEEAKNTDTLTKIKPRKPKYDGIKSPWFVLAAKDQLELKFSENIVKRGGWKVTTTLDLEKQQIAEEEVQKGLVQVRRQGGDSAAFVAEDVKTGQVVALVGGSDFSNPEYGQNNYAYDYRLPPGSSFKPYDYTALIENSTNVGAGTVLYDTLGPIPGHYPCTTGPKKGGNCLVNYDFRYPGPLSIRYALAGSRNVPAVKAMLIAGIDKTIQTAVDLGVTSGYKCYADDKLTTVAPCYASSAIGDGAYLRLNEHVHAFASLSRNGRNIPQVFWLKIEDASGKTFNEWKPEAGKQAVREDTAYIISDILSDPRASYMSRKFHDYKGHKFSLKTGTTNDAKDGWLMGYSTQYAAGVWVGYHNRRVEMRGFMESMTQPIWGGFMHRVHDNLKPEERHRPAGIQTLPAFVVRSHVGVASQEPSPTNDIYPSWYQKPTRTAVKQTIDIVSNKLATDCTPARAKKQLDNTDASAFSADTFANNQTNLNEKDDVHKCDDTKPSISLDAPSVCNNSCTFTATVAQGTHPLSSGDGRFLGTINFKIDDQIVQTYNISANGALSFTYPVAVSGSHTVSAEIIDSVLYDNIDSRTVNFSGGTGPSALTIQSAKVNGSNTKYKWSGGTGTITIYKSVTNSTMCSAGPSSECSGSSAPGTGAPAGTQVYAKDSNGNTSQPYTVTD